MSRIEELIQQLCPDGVKYVELQQVFDTRNGYTPPKSDTSLWVDGKIPWFRMEDIRENGAVLHDSIQHISDAAVKGGRLFPANSIIMATSATIGEHALITVPHLSNQRFTSLALKPEYADAFDMKFVFYYCFLLDAWCRANTTTSSFASVDMAGFKKFRFPLVPLEVQLEIVRILDSFTDLHTKLEAELKAELAARGSQYAHYRQVILDHVGAKLVPLCSLGKWFGGMTPSKANPAYWDHGSVPWLASMDVSNESTDAIRGRVTDLALVETSLRVLPAPSVAVVMRSNILRRTLPVGLIDVDTTVNQDIRALVPHPGVIAEYVYQALRADSERIRSACVRTDGSMAAVDSKAFFERHIPLPSPEEQMRIAKELREFELLITNLSTSLPAELSARREQFEHYRDRLLTFKELAT